MATQRSLIEFHQVYTTWMSVYRTALQVFADANDADSLVLLNQLDTRIKALHEEKRHLDRHNLEELYRLSRDPKFPHSVRTWMEDEWNDLWDSVS